MELVVNDTPVRMDNRSTTQRFKPNRTAKVLKVRVFKLRRNRSLDIVNVKRISYQTIIKLYHPDIGHVSTLLPKYASIDVVFYQYLKRSITAVSVNKRANAWLVKFLLPKTLLKRNVGSF